ncbi:MAG: hypothetical protein JSR95_12330 [Proteobacteria bacterium]|nr:hypothetical protein [Pseudomonadota bacterium]
MRVLEGLAATLLLMTLARAQEAKPVPEASRPAASAPAPPADSTTAPPGSGTPAAKGPAAADDDDDGSKPSKKAPRRFNPTDKGSADDDIPFPADI